MIPERGPRTAFFGSEREGALRLYALTSLRLYVFTSLRLHVFTSVSTSSRLYVSTSSRLYVSLYVFTSLRLHVSTSLRLYAPRPRPNTSDERERTNPGKMPRNYSNVVSPPTPVSVARHAPRVQFGPVTNFPPPPGPKRQVAPRKPRG